MNTLTAEQKVWLEVLIEGIRREFVSPEAVANQYVEEFRRTFREREIYKSNIQIEIGSIWRHKGGGELEVESITEMIFVNTREVGTGLSRSTSIDRFVEECTLERNP